MQLSLFPDPPTPPAGPASASIALIRIRPERNEWRFYRLDLWPDLFGQICVVREWGRIGRPGRCRRDPFPDHARAVHARAVHARDQLAIAKRRRGYRDAA